MRQKSNDNNMDLTKNTILNFRFYLRGNCTLDLILEDLVYFLKKWGNSGHNYLIISVMITLVQ